MNKYRKIKLDTMIRYWIEFDFTIYDRHTIYIQHGYGVTAENTNEALRLIKEQLFENEELPPVKKIIENVDIRTLDAGHVQPNIGICVFKGIWYPALNFVQ